MCNTEVSTQPGPSLYYSPLYTFLMKFQQQQLLDEPAMSVERPMNQNK